MKTTRILLCAGMALMLSGCASDEFTGEESSRELTECAPIFFGSSTNTVTRATHEESAALLGNKFYIYGTKTISGNTTTVFDNYVVEYAAGTANSTATNTADWEYAGKTSKKGATQGIKYWDFSAGRFDFVAAAGVGATEMIKNTTDGMRIQVADVDAVTNVYVADRVTATPTAHAATLSTPATVPYNSTVQFHFRRLNARMRVGFYEVVPGYAVKDLVFYYVGAPSGSYNVGVGSAFPTSGMYTISYDDATNSAVSTFAGSSNKMSFSNDFGALSYTSANSQEGIAGKPYLASDGSATATAENAFLGTTSAEATYGKGYYTIDGTPSVYSDFKPILPNENNTLKMQLRLDYTLVALDGSGDKVYVRDAYVSVPVQFLQWKPNYSYTYLFKISAVINGYSGDGGGGGVTVGPGRDPDPDNGGGDNDPLIDPTTGEVIPPYIPDPSWPKVPDPDDPTKEIPNPDAPLIPNPDYPTGPEGDQHDPSNPVPTPTVPDPDDPTIVIPDPENPSQLYPITFDAVVVEYSENNETVYTVIDGTNNSSKTEH